MKCRVERKQNREAGDLESTSALPLRKRDFSRGKNMLELISILRTHSLGDSEDTASQG